MNNAPADTECANSRSIIVFLDQQVPITAVAVGMLHCDVVPSHMLYAASGSLVGLGCLGEKVTSKGGPVLLSQNPICPCVGFGMYVFRSAPSPSGFDCLINIIESLVD